MTPQAREHLARADRLLGAARLLVERAYPADSVSRSYYAMFHAATAVLLERGIERSSHKGVISAFGEFLVKPGHLSTQLHASFRKAFDARQEDDYLASPSETPDKAALLLKEAQEFVAACQRLLEAPKQQGTS